MNLARIPCVVTGFLEHLPEYWELLDIDGATIILHPRLMRVAPREHRRARRAAYGIGGICPGESHAVCRNRIHVC